MVSLFLLVVVLLVAAFGLLALRQGLKHRTRWRSSRYYVPTFKANFDQWESKWTMDRKLHERMDKARWQQEFDRS